MCFKEKNKGVSQCQSTQLDHTKQTPQTTTNKGGKPDANIPVVQETHSNELNPNGTQPRQRRSRLTSLDTILWRPEPNQAEPCFF